MNQTSTNWNSTRQVPNYPSPKGLGFSKSVGTTPEQANYAEECAAWLARPDVIEFYNAVLNGTTGQSQANVNMFMDQVRYAQEAAHGGSQWGNGMGQGGVGGMPNAQAVPSGAKLGPLNNIVFNTEKGEFTYSDGLTQTVDVLSDQFNLNLSVKAKVDIEKTTDTRIKPATEVYKVTIHDPASQPADSVIFLSTDTKLDLKTLGGKGVTFHNGIENDKMPDGSARFTVGTFTSTDATATPGLESSVTGVEDPKNPGTFVYKPKIGEEDVINFQALPGKTQTHVVWADANIAVPAGDTANATLDTASGDLIIKVTHADDGTTDTYVVKAGYNAQLNNIKAEYLTFGNPPQKSGGSVPEAFKNRLTVPNLGAAAGGSENSVDAQKVINTLLSSTTRNENQLLSVLKAAGFAQYDSIDKFRSAIEKGEFPGAVNPKLLEFFRMLDPGLGETLSHPSIEASKQKSTEEAANKRMVELLSLVYPNSIVTKKDKLGFSIDGKGYSWSWAWDAKMQANRVTLDGYVEARPLSDIATARAKDYVPRF